MTWTIVLSDEERDVTIEALADYERRAIPDTRERPNPHARNIGLHRQGTARALRMALESGR